MIPRGRTELLRIRHGPRLQNKELVLGVKTEFDILWTLAVSFNG